MKPLTWTLVLAVVWLPAVILAASQLHDQVAIDVPSDDDVDDGAIYPIDFDDFVNHEEEAFNGGYMIVMTADGQVCRLRTALAVLDLVAGALIPSSCLQLLSFFLSVWVCWLTSQSNKLRIHVMMGWMIHAVKVVACRFYGGLGRFERLLVYQVFIGISIFLFRHVIFEYTEAHVPVRD